MCFSRVSAGWSISLHWPQSLRFVSVLTTDCLQPILTILPVLPVLLSLIISVNLLFRLSLSIISLFLKSFTATFDGSSGEYFCKVLVCLISLYTWIPSKSQSSWSRSSCLLEGWGAQSVKKVFLTVLEKKEGRRRQEVWGSRNRRWRSKLKCCRRSK